MNTRNPTPDAPDLNEVVAENIRAEMARERWSGRKAATALGLNQMYVSRRLSGETPMDANDIAAFARLLNVSIESLFQTTKKAPTPKSEGQTLPRLDSNQQPAGSQPAPETRATITRITPNAITVTPPPAGNAVITKLHA